MQLDEQAAAATEAAQASLLERRACEAVLVAEVAAREAEAMGLRARLQEAAAAAAAASRREAAAEAARREAEAAGAATARELREGRRQQQLALEAAAAETEAQRAASAQARLRRPALPAPPSPPPGSAPFRSPHPAAAEHGPPLEAESLALSFRLNPHPLAWAPA